MKALFLVAALFIANLPAASAQKKTAAETTKGMVVAFLDEGRLSNRRDQATIEDFEFFVKLNREIVKRDFAGIEFRVLKRGEILHLPDGTGLNVQNIPPSLGYVLAARGKKRKVLSGVQSDADFACAAAAFFRRSSRACPK